MPNPERDSGFSSNTLWSLFLDASRQKGREIAVVWSDGRITFDQLEPLVAARGTQLAALDPRPGSFLPVVVDYSLDSVVDVLACLCFRIPFAPIDPDSPPHRLEQLWKLLGEPTRFLAPRAVTDGLLPETSAQIGDTPGTSESQEPRRVSGSEHGLAIMTSGSTGTPKGVVLNFDVIDYRISHAIETFASHSGHGIVTSFSPLHFIGGIRQIAQIIAGRGILRIEPKSLHPIELLDRLGKENPTHLSIPAQLMRILGRAIQDSHMTLPRVVQVNVGAEGIRYEWLHGIKSLLPDDVIVRHSLGSTEAASSFVNVFRLREAPESGRVPIGNPISDGTLRLHPWDDDLPNVFEVWRSGAIVATYLGDKVHNEQRFEKDDDGTVWWKSGDLVELGSEGQYFHHSRTDDVTKIRGKLASPSETAAAIMSLDAVGRAIVLPDSSGDQTILVAHVEKKPGFAINGADIRQLLGPLLPEHLIPARVRIYDELPVSARGKIDRRILSANHHQK